MLPEGRAAENFPKALRDQLEASAQALRKSSQHHQDPTSYKLKPFSRQLHPSQVRRLVEAPTLVAPHVLPHFSPLEL